MTTTVLRRAAVATELWVGDTGRGTIRQVAEVFLQNAADDNVTWLGSDEIVTLTVNRQRGSAPAPRGRRCWSRWRTRRDVDRPWRARHTSRRR